MKTAPTGLQWITVMVVFGVASAMIGYPPGLPARLRSAVDHAVNGTARTLLRIYNQPVEDQANMKP